MIAIVSLLSVLAISFLVVRTGTVALSMTGLSEDVASFQSLSAFSGAGFTTEESESVVANQNRRKIIKLLIRLGSAGVVTVISSLILSFAGADQQAPLRLAILVGGLMVLILLSRSRWFQSVLTPLIKTALRRSTNLDLCDYANLLHIREGYTIAEMEVQPDAWLAHRTLTELRLGSEGVSVLGIVKPNGEYLGTPPPGQVFEPGDWLLLYGRNARLEELSHRRRQDEAAHRSAIVEQRQVREEEQEQAKDT
jgi:hypothetical protein